jgi:hypothetical protein
MCLYGGHFEREPMMSFSELRMRDKLLSGVAPGVQSLIPAAMKGSPLEKTGEVLSSLLTALESLKAGILDLSEAGNVYGANALFRVFLEHMLKMLGMFLKSIDEQSDDFTEQYLRLRVVEASQYVKAITAAKIDIKDLHDSPLAPWFKEGSELTGKERDALESPFKYKTLIETISDLSGQDRPSFLSKIVPNYCELSGFVHGGPSTSLILDALPTKAVQADKLLEDADLVVAMFFSAKRWLLMLAALTRPDLQSQLDQFDEAMVRFGQ